MSGLSALQFRWWINSLQTFSMWKFWNFNSEFIVKLHESHWCYLFLIHFHTAGIGQSSEIPGYCLVKHFFGNFTFALSSRESCFPSDVSNDNIHPDSAGENKHQRFVHTLPERSLYSSFSHIYPITWLDFYTGATLLNRTFEWCRMTQHSSNRVTWSGRYERTYCVFKVVSCQLRFVSCSVNPPCSMSYILQK